MRTTASDVISLAVAVNVDGLSVAKNLLPSRTCSNFENVGHYSAVMKSNKAVCLLI